MNCEKKILQRGNFKIKIPGGNAKLVYFAGGKNLLNLLDLIVYCPMSLPQLVGELHYICRGLRFEPRPSHFSTLRVKFLATRLLNKKKTRTCHHGS
jgi:hypothetical protein